jgi:hypothetical protein
MVLAQSNKQREIIEGNVRKHSGEVSNAPGVLTHLIITPGTSSKGAKEVLDQLAAEAYAVNPFWLADSIAKGFMQPGDKETYAFVHSSGSIVEECSTRRDESKHGSSTKRAKIEGREPGEPVAEQFVSFRNVFLNRMPGEIKSTHNKSIEDLIPESCECALFTSLFPESSTAWLRSKCAGSIGRVLLIADRIPKLPTDSPGAILLS